MTNKQRLITDEYDGYETRYPKILELSNKQLEEQMWTASETLVYEEDRLEMLYKLDERQQRVVRAILPMFRKYEDGVADFWVKVYAEYFKAPECKEAALVVAMMERAVHERFYDKINKVFGTDTDEHYLSYLQDPIFKGRAKWLGETLNGEDKHATCLVYGLVEGVSLFSMFSLLRSFQSKGYNRIATTVKGTKQSSMDEILHSDILATSFNYLYSELGIKLKEDTKYYNILKEQTNIVVENEKYILTQLLGEGSIFNGVHIEDYFGLVEMLANDYHMKLGCDEVPYPEAKSSIYEWFTSSSVGYSDPDFFGKGANKEYESAWNEDAFGKVWKQE